MNYLNKSLFFQERCFKRQKVYLISNKEKSAISDHFNPREGLFIGKITRDSFRIIDNKKTFINENRGVMIDKLFIFQIIN